MKVIEKYILQDGTKIQLEDWHDYNSEEYPDLYGYVIGSYPIAKNTGKYGLVRSRHSFRLSVSINKYSSYFDQDVKNDFESLKNGSKKLQDLSDHFWNGDKDKWYLGMDVANEGW